MTACSPPSDDPWEALRRREFPGARINLNAGTLGTAARSVRAAQREFWRGGLRAWPLGQYQRARVEVRRVRELAGELWGPAAVAVTGGTSEAMTRVTLALRARLGAGPVRVLTSGHEHAGGLQGLLRLAGWEVLYLPDHALADPGVVAEEVARLRPQVLLLSQRTYTTGQEVPVERHIAAARGHEPGLWTVVDAAQALGLVAPALVGADVVVGSGHKWLFGPPGSGLMWLSERARGELAAGAAGEALDPEAPCAAFERAGGHDFSVHAGLAAALELHARLGPAAVLARSRALAGAFAAALHAGLRERAIDHVFFARGEARREPPSDLVGAVHVHFPALDPYPAYAALDARGIHLKCIKGTRPGGLRLAVLRACLPCYESPARLHTAVTRIVEALTESARA
jgi:UDP-sulfoquinovose synthase